MPDDHGEWQSLDDYFFARRNWTLGPIFAVFALTLVIEIPSTIRLVESASWANFINYIAINSIALLALTIAWRSSRPRVVATASLVARRLHDLGKSAVWLIPILAYFAMLRLVFITWPGINNTWIAFLLSVPMLIVVLWLIGAPGEKHENRFGAATTTD